MKLFGNVTSSGELEHQQAQRLLPWLVNGTLAGRELEQVRQHVERCSDCGEDVAAQLVLARELGTESELAPSPHPARVRSLLARIDAVEPGRSPRRRRWLGARVASWLVPRRLANGADGVDGVDGAKGAVPRGIWALVAVQTSVVLAICAVLLIEGRERRAPAEYHTLSVPRAVDPETAGPRLRLVFEESASAAEIRSVLESVAGRIVDGPTALGVYTVELPGARSEGLGATLELLRRQSSVRFVEPVGGR